MIDCQFCGREQTEYRWMFDQELCEKCFEESLSDLSIKYSKGHCGYCGEVTHVFDWDHGNSFIVPTCDNCIDVSEQHSRLKRLQANKAESGIPCNLPLSAFRASASKPNH